MNSLMINNKNLLLQFFSGISLSSSTSLHILRQLEQKQHALDLFFSFLVDLKLWERLSAVVSFGVVMATTHVLAEQAEKLVAAIALHQLQTEHGSYIETAIRLALESEREKPSGKLNAKDIFYRRVRRKGSAFCVYLLTMYLIENILFIIFTIFLTT